MKPGDKVELTLTDETIQGTLMPSEDSDHVIIANGLRTGDVMWQNKLSERDSRESVLLEYSTN